MGRQELKKLSLSKCSWVSSTSTKSNASPCAKASEESWKNISPERFSEVKAAPPDIGDEPSNSLSSIKSKNKIDSSTATAYTGAEQVMAPPDLRTYLLSQVFHTSGCTQSEDLVKQHSEGTTYRISSLAGSHNQAKEVEL